MRLARADQAAAVESIGSAAVTWRWPSHEGLETSTVVNGVPRPVGSLVVLDVFTDAGGP